MAKLWQFLQGHPKPAFSEKVQKGDQGKLFKNRPKRCPRLKGPKTLWRKWHYPLNSMCWKCKDWRGFCLRQRLQNCANGQVIAIFAGSPQKPHFLKKRKGRTKANFLKNRPKGCPRWKGAKALLRKWRYSLICIHLNCKDWRRFWGKQETPKVPEWPSYGNFCKVTQTPHFLKKCRGGTKGNFSKIAQKVALVWKAQTHTGANGIIL